VGQQVTVDFRCTDRGGSSLRTCAGDLRPGDRLDTSTPGTHTLHLTATDGAGNTTTVTRRYTVTASYQPAFSPNHRTARLKGGRVVTKLPLVNDGTYADTFLVTGATGGTTVRIQYKVGHQDVTRLVRLGRYRTPVMQPGEKLVLRVVAGRTERTRPGMHRNVKLRATSMSDSARLAFARVLVTTPARG